MTSLTNNITTALLSFFGLSSVFFGIKAYFVDAVQSTGLNLENSAIAVIFSLVGALLTALMKFMNSMKNVDDNIAKTVQVCEKQLEISNKTLETQNKILDSQSKNLEIQNKILDSQSRIFEVLNKTLDKQVDLLDVVKDSIVEEIVDVDDEKDRYIRYEQRERTERKIALPASREDTRKIKKPEQSGTSFPVGKRTPVPKNR